MEFRRDVMNFKEITEKLDKEIEQHDNPDELEIIKLDCVHPGVIAEIQIDGYLSPRLRGKISRYYHKKGRSLIFKVSGDAKYPDIPFMIDYNNPKKVVSISVM